MPTASFLDDQVIAGSATLDFDSVSVSADDLLLIVFQANSAISGGPPNTFPTASGLTVTFNRFAAFNSDNALNTKYHRCFFYGMPTTDQTGIVTITLSGTGWNAAAHLIRVQGVLPGANGANAILQTDSVNRNAASGNIDPALVDVQATSSIVGMAAKNVGGQWVGTDEPYTTVSGPSNRLFTFFRDDPSFPSVTVQTSPNSHAAGVLLELGPSGTDFWGWADDFGTSDNGWAVFR